MENQVSFCFLVTGNLKKEKIWIQWFEGLENLNFKFSIYVHCSNPNDITSEWFKKFILPSQHIKPTSWGNLMIASMQMYDYSLENSNANWYINISESHVPFISPKKFINYYNAYKNKTLLAYCDVWWDVNTHNRSNLNLIEHQHRFAHQHWCIICKDDMSSIIELFRQNHEIVTKTISGPCSDESVIAVYLSYLNNLNNVINQKTTIVDWERPVGDSPHTFHCWGEEDQQFLDRYTANNKNCMFFRKVGSSFPDSVIHNWWNL
jgi:hypothetical protein